MTYERNERFNNTKCTKKYKREQGPSDPFMIMSIPQILYSIAILKELKGEDITS